MHVLITGVNGFVGQALYKSLTAEHIVTGIYNNGSAMFTNCHKVNLSNEKETLDFFSGQENKIDVVIHLASKMAATDNLKDVSLLSFNPTIAKNIALGMKEANIKHVLNLSSSSVYPNVDGSFDESCAPDPSPNSDCIYGLSKFNSEIVLNHFLNGTGSVVTHLRSSMIYGEGMHEAHILSTLKKELEEKNTVTLFGNGERLLNMIHVSQLARYINFFIHSAYEGIVNVSDECISLFELGKRIVGKGNENKILLRTEGNKNKFILDIGKLKNLTGQKSQQ